jgi:methionyl aminopeptidase
MTVIIKSKKEIEHLKEAGPLLARVIAETAQRVQPGISTKELDTFAENLMFQLGGEPAFKGYQPEGAQRPFPATLCVSVNDEIVHGIPNNDTILQEGDIVTVDGGFKYKNVYTDHAVTVPVGKISKQLYELMDTTREAMLIGIKAAQPGNTTGDIGYAIQNYVDNRYGIVRELAGHGVGRAIHEDPYIPNYGHQGQGIALRPGMVVAIEPMLNIGSRHVDFLDDGYTVVTRDGNTSAHFEHTVLITEDGPEILTMV